MYKLIRELSENGRRSITKLIDLDTGKDLVKELRITSLSFEETTEKFAVLQITCLPENLEVEADFNTEPEIA
jgi:hypothetical protein